MSDRFVSNDFTNKSTKYTMISPIKTDDGTETPAKPEKPKRHGVEKPMTFGERIVDNFSSISYKEWGNHLMLDWFFPEVIRTVDGFLKQVFFGDKNARILNRSGSTSDRASMYHNVIPSVTEAFKRTTAGKRNFRHVQIYFPNEEEAIGALDDIRESLAMNTTDDPVVTVRELYSIANLPTDNTMNRWGWRDLEDVNLIEYGANGEYMIEMPPAEPIDRRTDNG